MMISNALTSSVMPDPRANASVLDQSLSASFASILAQMDDAGAAQDQSDAAPFNANGLFGREETGYPTEKAAADSRVPNGDSKSPQSSQVLTSTDLVARMDGKEAASQPAYQGLPADDSGQIARHVAQNTGGGGAEPEHTLRMPGSPAIEADTTSMFEPHEPVAEINRSSYNVTVSTVEGSMEVVAGIANSSVEFLSRARQVLQHELQRAGVYSYRLIINGELTTSSIEREHL